MCVCGATVEERTNEKDVQNGEEPYNKRCMYSKHVQHNYA